ncbi:LAMI_0E04214g1_1 [Lachancea mirantina]|uniref:Conserved oligomeric Golgi complex subunit 6 n=1 Tax=Lachancea mirantina TaxID=1230905 RepID=A0A1G4JK88_9SACH|nr:LAMI_0E04214g1_1 [Lachancea mirantina]
MSFLEFQLGDAFTDSGFLPEPASALPLDSVPLRESHKGFQVPVPDLLESREVETNTLQERMKLYVDSSMRGLELRSQPASNRDHDRSAVPGATSHLADREQSLKQMVEVSGNYKPESSDSVISRKLSRILNEYDGRTYQKDQDLRRSFLALEAHRKVLAFNESVLVQPSVMGSLARQSLKSNLEHLLLQNNLTFLENIRPVVNKIQRLSEPIERTLTIGNRVCEKRPTPIPDEVWCRIKDKQEQLQTLKMQKTVLSAVRDSLTLSQIEDHAIRNAEIDTEFLLVVNRIMIIKERATYLLTLPSAEAGKALLKHVNSQLEIANKRIYNYLVDFLYDLQSAYRTFGERSFTSNDKTFVVFRKCLVYLSSDLPYFSEFLKRVVKMRSQAALDNFLSQFDVESSSESKPIILSAHDPIRYLGDVLAYVHSLIVNEADFVNSMFDFQTFDEEEDSPQSIINKNQKFLSELNLKALNDIMVPLENSIRIRLEQIIRFEDDILTNFDIFDLLKLYEMIFTKYGIFEDSTLIRNLNALENVSSNKIGSTLTDTLSTIDTRQEIGADLLPPSWLAEYLTTLCGVFARYEKSSYPEDAKQIVSVEFLNETTGRLVNDKLEEFLHKNFPDMKRNPSEKENFLVAQINCFDNVISKLKPFKSTVFDNDGNILIKVENQMQSSIKALTEFESRLLFQKTGLELYFNLFNMIFPVESVQDELDYDMYLSTLENPIMNLTKIRESVEKPVSDLMPAALDEFQKNKVFHIMSPRIGEQITNTCLRQLLRFYQVFRQVLLHLYPDSQEEVLTVLKFTGDEAAMLFGLSD